MAEVRERAELLEKRTITVYWLKVISRLLPDIDLEDLKVEANELWLIMRKIVSTMRNREYGK